LEQAIEGRAVELGKDRISKRRRKGY